MRAIITDAGASGATESREPIPSLELFDSPRAWRMVAAAFVAMCAVYGVAYSFGAFFKPMAVEFGAHRSATSAVFSITVLVWCVLGPLTGHLSDRFGPRIVVATGAVVMGLGLALTSMIDRLWLGYLTYGLGVGVGVACAYVPMVAVVGGWFLRRRNTALGIAVAGIGFGTVFGAPIAAALIDSSRMARDIRRIRDCHHCDPARMRLYRRAAARPRDAVSRPSGRRAAQSGVWLSVRIVGDRFDCDFRAVRLSAVVRARPRRE